MKLSLQIFLMLCLIHLNVMAQENVSIGKYKKLTSKILGGDVTYIEHLPEGYDNSGNKYPVVFMMNGQDASTFANAVATLEYLSSERIPDMILIGISNTGSAETSLACPDDSGRVKSGVTFQSFLEKELLPEINKNYRTNNYKILMGQSNTGLLVMYSLFTNPSLFDAYVVASPMFGWCPDFYMSKTEEFLNRNDTINKKLYVTYGDLDYLEVASKINQFEDLLKNNSSKEFKWKLDRIENCGHVPQITLNNALLFFFSECTMTAERKKLSVEEIKSHFKSLSKEYGFTVQPKAGILSDIAFDLRSEKKYEKAIEILKYLVSIYPNSAMYYFRLGSVQSQSGDNESAKKSLEESLKIDPNFTRAKQLLERINIKDK